MSQFRIKREESDLTQLEVATALGIDKSAVSKWETSETFPRAELLPKIAQLYNCSIDELLEFNSE